MPALTFATRPSALARWQTDHVIRLLQAAWPGLRCDTRTITTQGDRDLHRPLPEIGGKGLFTLELEEALRAGSVDAAVHSLKDLPTEEAPGLVVGVIPSRADPRDVWVCPAGHRLDDIPEGALVGTSSLRRRAQLLARRPDLNVQPIRGNVDTRLRKVLDGQYDAITLAAAGLVRLGFGDRITAYLPIDIMLPAPGQGALAVQCRSEDERTRDILRAIEDASARRAVMAERSFLDALGGGCSLPVGAYAALEGTSVALRAVVISLDGDRKIELSGCDADPVPLGVSLAEEALAQGAAEIFEAIR